MLRHYFKAAWRALARQKTLAFINVAGLSVGIACFILFLLYAINELTYDRFHRNGATIYRVYEQTNGINGGPAQASASTPMPLAPAMKADLPDVEQALRVQTARGASIVRVGKNIHRVSVSYADPAFFQVFSFPLTAGNPATALQDLHSLVLTESEARTLFGTTAVTGRTLEIKVDTAFRPFTITAVAKNVPANSSIRFAALGNFNFLATTTSDREAVANWYRTAYSTFVQLRPGSTLSSDSRRLEAFRKVYYPDEAAQMKKNGLTWQANRPPVSYGLQPLADMHTDARIDDGSRIDIRTIWILLGIAAGVLLIACINFTTLAIGRSAGRGKEVGIRKVAGAAKGQLIFQFLSEALLLSLLSAGLGLLLAFLLLPYFNGLSGRELSLSFATYPQLGWMLVALALVVGLITGSYPALVLSAFKPVAVLKGRWRVGGANLFTRSLVTFQFAVSIGLIIATVVILRQTTYLTDKNPGFQKENLVLINAADADAVKIYPLFRQALEGHAGIKGVTRAAIGLGEGEDFWVTGFKYRDKPVYACFNPVDLNYVSVLGMQLLAGRNFNPRIASDTVTSVIINEAMVKEFGWAVETAVGQTLDGFAPDKTPVVIGVIKDFHFRHAGEEIKPQLFAPFFDKNYTRFYVRLQAGHPEEALAAIQKAWATLAPQIPLQYSFLDEKLEALYKAEQRWSRIVGWAGGISIFLACLGLFGLAALAAANRVKEIGIRKVLGAPVHRIVTLLAADFVKLILIALAVAVPVAGYFMHQWLQSFANRVDLGISVFFFSGIFALAIAVLTISAQAIKAGVANPVKSLRSE